MTLLSYYIFHFKPPLYAFAHTNVFLKILC